jgi:hypothetical protein
MGKGSLGEVLPANVRARFIGAAADAAIREPAPPIERPSIAPVPLDDFAKL